MKVDQRGTIRNMKANSKLARESPAIRQIYTRFFPARSFNINSFLFKMFLTLINIACLNVLLSMGCFLAAARIMRQDPIPGTNEKGAQMRGSPNAVVNFDMEGRCDLCEYMAGLLLLNPSRLSQTISSL